jgi:hypothetical protein
MIIQDSSVQLHARHAQAQSSETRLSIRLTRNNPPPASASISPGALEKSQALDSGLQESSRRLIEFEVSLLKLLVERLTGKKIEMVATVEQDASETAAEPATAKVDVARQEWGLSVDISTHSRQSERLSFQSSAEVSTADGRKLSLTLSLNYSREIETSSALSVRAGQAMKDPLVLTYPGTALELSRSGLEFDLDVDGVKDVLPGLSSHSAYLALDRDTDGLINDGRELFGALSGDGFADLREFDVDGNGWIDERDPVFSRLRLLHVGVDGEPQIITLEQGNVGALYLGNVQTPFRLTEPGTQNTTGQLRSSGLFVTESGEAGSLQQLDVVV